MSRTNLDFLFQVTAPVADRTCFNMPRAEEPEPGFVDHLSLASAPTTNGLNTASNSDDRAFAGNAPTTDYDHSTAELSRDEKAESADAEASDRDDTEADVARHRTETDATQKNDAEGDTDEVSVETGDDSDADRDETGDPTEVAAAADQGNENAAIATTVDLQKSAAATPGDSDSAAATTAHLQESTVVAHGETQEQVTTGTRKMQTFGPGSPHRAVMEKALAGTLSQKPIEPSSDAAVDAIATGELVDGAPARRASKRSREAKVASQAQDGVPKKDGVASSNERDLPYVKSDVAINGDSAKATEEFTTTDQSLTELGQTGDGESKKGNDDEGFRVSARQPGDAAALAGKVVAVANGILAQSDSVAAPSDTVERTGKAGKADAMRTDGVTETTNRIHTSQAEAKRGSRTNGADEMPRVDPARFVGRVAKAFHTAQDRGGTLQIRLSPPELGAMRLELTVKDGVMTAALETETASARRVLLEHLPALRDRLAEQNIRVERFDVEVRRDGAGGQTDPRAAQDQQQPQQGHSELRRRHAVQPPIAEPARQNKPIIPTRTDSNGINLVA